MGLPSVSLCGFSFFSRYHNLIRSERVHSSCFCTFFVTLCYSLTNTVNKTIQMQQRLILIIFRVLILVTSCYSFRIANMRYRSTVGSLLFPRHLSSNPSQSENGRKPRKGDNSHNVGVGADLLSSNKSILLWDEEETERWVFPSQKEFNQFFQRTGYSHLREAEDPSNTAVTLFSDLKEGALYYPRKKKEDSETIKSLSRQLGGFINRRAEGLVFKVHHPLYNLRFWTILMGLIDCSLLLSDCSHSIEWNDFTGAFHGAKERFDESNSTF